LYYNQQIPNHIAHFPQQCHNCTYRPFPTTLSQLYISPISHNTVTTVHIAHFPQQCHNCTYHPFPTTLSQLHISPHLPQHCHNSKCVIFQERLLKVLKCYNFLYVQRRHNCSPAASLANCVMTLYLLKVYPQTFLSIPITEKCQILSCDTLVANERYIHIHTHTHTYIYIYNVQKHKAICILIISLVFDQPD
jgi:hypothetical protein